MNPRNNEAIHRSTHNSYIDSIVPYFRIDTIYLASNSVAYACSIVVNGIIVNESIRPRWSLLNIDKLEGYPASS